MTHQRRLWVLREERLVADNVLLGAGTISAGILGFGFQILIAHRLVPADYGAVFGVLAVLTVVGLPAGAVGLLMARETSRDRATGRSAPSSALLREGHRLLLFAGWALAAVVFVTSPWLASFLNLRGDLLVAMAAGLPFALALPLLAGELQGQQRFGAFSLLMGGQAAFKLVGAALLGMLYGPVGVVLGISISTTVVYLVARGLVRRKLAIETSWPWRPSALRYLAVVFPSTVALALLLSTDVLLVRHYFPAKAAGEYAAVAALGRAFYFAAAGVPAVLFPKVIFREAQGKSGYRLVLGSLAMVILGTGVGLMLVSFGSKFLLTAFAGLAYSGGAAILASYALGMSLLGGASVLIATHQSRGKAPFLGLLIPIALLEPGLIAWLHASLLEVVLVVDACMAILVAGLAAAYLVEERVKSRYASPLPLIAQLSATTEPSFSPPEPVIGAIG